MTTETTTAPAPAPATSIATTPPAAPQQAPDWRSQLPEEYRAHTGLKDYKDLGGLVKSHLSLQTMIGVDKVVVPNEKSTPEQVAEFYKKLGRPEKPEEYKLPPVKFTNGASIPEQNMKHFMEVFHKEGLSQKQAEKLFTEYMNFEGKMVTDNEAVIKRDTEAGLAKLKEEWGQAYEQNLALAQMAVKQHGSPEFNEWLIKTGLGNDPQFIKYFSDIGRKTVDDKAVGGGGMTFTETPGQALAEITSMKADKEVAMALSSKQHPKHKETLARWTHLHKMASAQAPIRD